MLAVRASLLALFALIGCALAIDLARAQSPTAETGTTLRPGVNLVGWTAEPTPVSQLFREIPQLESIWAWDAELRDWIVAGRGAPEWLGGLGRVWPGMGLRLVLGGDQPYLWQRSTEPTRGLVKLRTGWNLVAWSGADQTPINDAVKGIGWSLRTVRRWNPATQQWTSWTSPERTAQLIAAGSADQGADDSPMPGIRRGEALWIEVARAVNWLQPTGILPRLVFPGGASQQLQARVREDLESVLAFYRTQYGIQADPDFTVYVAKDVDALIQAQKDDGEDIDEADAASTRALWAGATGWAGSQIVVKQSSWPDDLATDEIAWVRYVITHEYFHILQGQLRGERASASRWLAEGTASWIDSRHTALDKQQPLSGPYKGLLSQITYDTPTLRSTENDNANWHYTLGQLATDRLATDSGQDSAIEFWRQLAPTEIGSHRRWISTPDWRAVFHRVSSQPISEFYADFDAWQHEQAAANAASPRFYENDGGLVPPGSYEQDGNIILGSYEYDGSWIRGRVTGAGGAPVAGLLVNAIRVEGETSVGTNRRAATDVDGSFAIQAPEDGDYRLSVDIDDNCTGYYHRGELVAEEEGAQPVRVAGVDVDGIEIGVPGNVCGWYVRGSIAGPGSESLSGMAVRHCDIAMNRCFSPQITGLDGSFAIPIVMPGDYRLRLDLSDGCSVYYRRGRIAADRDEATPITIMDSHVHGLLMRVSERMCAHQLKGRITRPDGQPLADARISACLAVASDCVWASRHTDDDGVFAITVPTEGEYHLQFTLDSCTIYFHGGGLTTTHSERLTARVEGRDLRLSPRQIPEGMCAWQIRSRIAQANGQPLTDTRVSVCLEVNGECASYAEGDTDDDGAFAITVPEEGAYRINFDLDGCTIYFRRGGLTTNSNEQGTVTISGRNIRLVPRQISEGMCAHRISGHFVDSSGTPLSERWINAFGAGSSGGVWTDPDGRFEIRVPSNSAYTFGIQLRSQPYCWRNLAGQALGSSNNPIRVSGADVTGITLRLPGTVEELCE